MYRMRFNPREGMDISFESDKFAECTLALLLMRAPNEQQIFMNSCNLHPEEYQEYMNCGVEF